MHVANVVQSLLHHNSSRRLHIFLAITMDNLECRVIRIRTDNRRENWSRMPMNDDGLDITKFYTKEAVPQCLKTTKKKSYNSVLFRSHEQMSEQCGP